MIATKGFNSIMSKEEGLKYLAVKIAPTIFGVKPAVLLTLKDSPRRPENNLYTFFIQNKHFICRTLNVEISELKNCGICAKVIFFRRDLMRMLISNDKKKDYLAEFGYGDCSDLDEYLQKLKSRFNSDDFPHEIGIFLGYPLKDVYGFVNCHEKCRNTEKTPWKVFGDPEPSLKIIDAHRKARKSMFSLIYKITEFEDLMSKLSAV